MCGFLPIAGQNPILSLLGGTENLPRCGVIHKLHNNQLGFPAIMIIGVMARNLLITC